MSHPYSTPGSPGGEAGWVFTDIEGSTKLLEHLGEAAYADVLAEHRRALRDVFGRYGGVEVDTQGDAFFYVFPETSSGIDAAREDTSTGPLRRESASSPSRSA
jgi:class 3 adenylate cyclase